MTPRKLHAQPIYLDPGKAELLDTLSAETRIPKAVLLREAIDDLLTLNGRGEFSDRVREVRNAFRLARRQLVAYRKEIEQKNLGVAPLRSCEEAIGAIDKAREEFGV